MKPSLLITSIVVTTLAACDATPAPSALAQRVAPSAPARVTAALTPSTPRPAVSGVTPGMPYAAFRSAVIKQGWQPKPDPECLANVVGSNYRDVCSSDASQCRACTDMPELSAYSGDGQALAYFQHSDGRRVLEVGASGVLRSWNEPGHETDLQVASWTVQPAAQ